MEPVRLPHCQCCWGSSPVIWNDRAFGRDFIRDRFSVLGRMNFSSPYVDLPQRLTVRENLTVYAKLYGVKNITARIEQVVEEFKLDAFVDRRCVGLSSWDRRLGVSLAKALINRPEFLLLDEPTASLDPDTSLWIRTFYLSIERRMRRRSCFASHDMHEVELLCDPCIIDEERETG